MADKNLIAGVNVNYALPSTGNNLSFPDHAKLHRVVATNTSAPDKSITINDSGVVHPTNNEGTFVDGDLSTGVLTVTHNLGLTTAPYILIVLVANNSNQKIEPDFITFSTNSFTIDLTSYGTITGTYAYKFI